MMMLKVKLGKDGGRVCLYGTKTPIEPGQVVDVPDDSFYRRRIADGSLELADEDKPAKSQRRDAQKGD